MSIASMVDTAVARQQADDPHKVSPAVPAGVSTNLVNQITRWIPTETITIYIALLALLASQPASSSFTSRWVLFGALVAVNPLVVVLVMMAKSTTANPFKLPVFEMVVAPVAFAAWAFALPDTPLSSISGYDIKWNTAIILVSAVAVTLIANALHKSPDFDQIVTKQQGANAKSPESLPPAA
jgi:uncharacterized membrane protein